jgi:arginine N-succinyltransferase
VRELFPKYPIYPWMLPAEASNTIGQIHPDTLPAKKMLEKQGFRPSPYHNIFDAGPHYYAATDDILAVRESKEAIVSEIHDGKLPISAKALISNTQLDFRATIAFLTLDENGQVILTKKMAEALNCHEGDKVRILTQI